MSNQTSQELYEAIDALSGALAVVTSVALSDPQRTNVWHRLKALEDQAERGSLRHHTLEVLRDHIAAAGNGLGMGPG